ncbi:homoserine kinase [Caldivirga sp. UBA161]|uniref:homoserine kinase n=1 Tax=Caldivirga sp. UBA161 TaxID=1915569 RepID=UPI0025BCEB42|nr:homoserine kinase [Caldivirga sp. UBA161]
MGTEELIVEAPASIANLGPAFDIAALAVNPPSDIVKVKVTDGDGIFIRNSGEYALSLPSESNGNSAYLVANRAIELAGLRRGIDIEVIKRIKPASGLGSSGATSAAVAYALNKLLNLGLSEWDLVELASYGELASAGVRHMDNVAASLFGGLVIVNPMVRRVIKVNFPELSIVVVIEGSKPNTGFMRSILPKAYDLGDVVANMANVAQLVASVLMNDLDLFSKVITNDRVAMPYRVKAYEHWGTVKNVLENHGALGVILSGAGPSIAAFFKKEPHVGEIKAELMKAGLSPVVILTKPSNEGVKEVNHY